ncbi:MAG: hypothetical protein WDZ80_05200, partial [Candidatus Paceibacterota bacterium]
MKNISKNPLFYLSIILTITAGFMVFNFVSAQTYEGPTTSFPEGNTATPIPSTVLDGSGDVRGLNFTGSGRKIIGLNNGHIIGFGTHPLMTTSNGFSFNGEIKLNNNLSANEILLDFAVHRGFDLRRENNTNDESANLVFNSRVGGNYWEFAHTGDTIAVFNRDKLDVYKNLDMNSNDIVGVNNIEVSTINGIDADDLGGAAESCDADSICEGNMF